MFFFVSKKNYFSNKLYEKIIKIKTLKKIEWLFISDKKELNEQIVIKNPQKLFFFHWSFIVPKKIYEKYECINLHTSNLPDGKGGSPLQNQIIDDIIISRVNALRMTGEIDGGAIYCSRNVTLQGNIFDIWNMITHVSLDIIKDIIKNNPLPIKQIINGTEKIYKRRKNNIIPFKSTESLEKIYDFIRMLDSPYYPEPYVDIGNFRLSFNRSRFNGENIISDVHISKLKE